MTARLPAADDVRAAAEPARARRTAWPLLVLRASRPRQWPKNLLVFAAPLAADTLGKNGGFGRALAAAAAFVAASAAVYLINDVIDADRDRTHPVKRQRPIASGELRASHALAVAVGYAVAGLSVGFIIGEPLLSAAIGLYLVLSVLYSVRLKHVPVIEMAFVASGFVLRALGGAAATRVAPSIWFLVVCSLGAVMVAVAKRYTELTALGPDATRHRPVMRRYSPATLRQGQRVVACAMIVSFLLWASGDPGTWMRFWHAAAVLPLTAAIIRFDYLTRGPTSKPVEDLIARDSIMVAFEALWLALFAIGLYAGSG